MLANPYVFVNLCVVAAQMQLMYGDLIASAGIASAGLASLAMAGEMCHSERGEESLLYSGVCEF